MTGHELAYSLVPGEQATGDAYPHCWAPGLLASVEIALHGVHPATEDEQRLYEAIPVRHTVRTPFVKGIEMNKAVELELAPHQEGVHSKLVKDQEVRSLLERAAQASWELAGDEKYRAELRAWTGNGVHVSSGYGVPADRLAPKRRPIRQTPAEAEPEELAAKGIPHISGVDPAGSRSRARTGPGLEGRAVSG